MKNNKHLATMLAILLAAQNTVQPLSVFAENGEEPVVAEEGATEPGTGSDAPALDESPTPVEVPAAETVPEVAEPEDEPKEETNAEDPVASEDETTDKTVPAKGNEEDEVPVFSEMQETGPYEGLANYDDSSKLETVTINGGKIDENNPEVPEGFVFVRAYLIGDESKLVKAVREWNGKKYFISSEDQEEAQLLDQTVVVEYREDKNQNRNEEGEESKETKPESETGQVEAAGEIVATYFSNVAGLVGAPAKDAETTSEPQVIYYSVTFEDAAGEEPVTHMIKAGECVAVVPSPANVEGKIFTGWKNGDENWDKSMPVTGNLTLKPQYADMASAITVTINYLFGDGTQAAQSYVAKIIPGSGFNKPIPSPTVTGCTASEESYIIDASKLNKDTSIDIYYTGDEVNYTVNFVKEGESTPFKTETRKGNRYAMTDITQEWIDNEAPDSDIDYEKYEKGTVENIMIPAEEDTTLTVFFAYKPFAITYESDAGKGGNYVAPQYVPYGTELSAVEPSEHPTKSGYSFKGWNYKIKVGDKLEDYTGSTMPADNLVAEAQWEANETASYKVVYWQEKADSEDANNLANYVVATTEGANGKPDIVEVENAVVGSEDLSFKTRGYTGFSLNESLTEADLTATSDDKQKVVLPDGSTVRNVYYQRNYYEIRFYDRFVTGYWLDWKYDSTFKESISIKYGENINTLWSKKVGNKHAYSSESGSQMYTTQTNMPAHDLEVYFEGTFEHEADIVYYVESLDPDKKWDVFAEIPTGHYTSLTEEDKQSIEGFTFKEWDASSSKTQFKDKITGKKRYGGYLIYSRNSYEIKYENVINLKNSDPIKYQASLSDKIPTEKDLGENNCPYENDKDYEFEGWYTAPDYTPEHKFNLETMPAHSLTLYAHWVAPKKTVSFVSNSEVEIQSKEVVKYETVEDLPEPTMDGADFVGWYTDPALTRRFVPNTLIVKDITLYAKWDIKTKVGYTVTCIDADKKPGEEGYIIQTDNPTDTVDANVTVRVNAPEIDGYYPVLVSKNVKFNSTDPEDNVVEFTYKKKSAWTYVIHYVDSNGTDIQGVNPETITTTDSIVSTHYKQITGWVLDDDYSKSVEKPEKDDVVHVTYKYMCDTSTYTVIHKVQKLNEQTGEPEYELIRENPVNARVGTFTKVKARVIEGHHVVNPDEKWDIAISSNQEKNIITITYDLDDHKVNYVLKEGTPRNIWEGSLPIEETVKYGSKLDVAAGLTANDGYVFNGWTLSDGTLVPEGYKVTTDVTLVGSFSRKEDRKITVTGINEPYDGKAKAIQVGGTAAGDIVTFLYNNEVITNEFTNVADKKTVMVKVVDAYGKVVGITTAEVNITPKLVTVTTYNAKKTYDGTPLTDSTVTIQGIVPGETVGCETIGSQTDAGNSGNTYRLTFKGEDETSTAIRNNYTVEENLGTLTVDKRNVTLTSATDSKEYDGTPLTNGEVTVSGDGFVKEEGATYNFTGSQTVKGSSANAFSYTLKEGTNADNYNITKTEGTLTVTDRANKFEITMQANSDKVKYDGDSHAVNGFETDTFNIDGVEFTVSGLEAAATGTDAGEYAVNVTGTPVVQDSQGNDVTGQFTVKTAKGKLTISQRNVTLASESADKEYDGTPLTNDKVTVSGDGFVKEEGATYNFTGSQTVKGSSANAFSYTLKEGTNADNYNITKTEGTLTVTDRVNKFEITVEANSDSVTYTGLPQMVKGVVTTDFDVNGIKFRVLGVEAEAAGTDADTYISKVVKTEQFMVMDAEYNDVTDQFDVSFQDGTLTIDPAPLTVTTESASRAFNGSALTATGSVEGLVNGETVGFETTGSQTYVGESDNNYTLTFANNEVQHRFFSARSANEFTAKRSNYAITQKIGKLVVTDRSDEDKYRIALVGNSDTVTYDGQNHTVSGFVEDSFEFEGHVYTVTDLTAEVSGINYGTYKMEVTGEAVVRDAAGEDVTGQFVVSATPGTLVINKAPLTVVTESASKRYDGVELRAGGSVAGAVGTEKVEITLTGTITDEGSVPNGYILTYSNGALASNYQVSETIGTLTVTKATGGIVVEPGSGLRLDGNGYVKVYDGIATPITAYALVNPVGQHGTRTETVSITYRNAAGQTVTASDLVNVGEYTAKLTVDNKNYAIDSLTVKIKITPAPLTVVTDGAVKNYDGQALTAGGTVTGAVGSEVVTITTTGSITEVGSVTNGYTLSYTNGALASNYYEVDPILGTLTVNPLPLPQGGYLATTVPNLNLYTTRGRNVGLQTINTSTGLQTINTATGGDKPASSIKRINTAVFDGTGFWGVIASAAAAILLKKRKNKDE